MYITSNSTSAGVKDSNKISVSSILFSSDTNCCGEHLLCRGKAHVDASQRGEHFLNPSRDKQCYSMCSSGEKSLLCDPASELRQWEGENTED